MLAKRIKDFPNYFIREDGLVWSLNKHRFLSPCPHTQGYHTVHLCNKGKVKTHFIHRLVAEAFLDKTVNTEVNHIDGDKQNNHVQNLEWVTHSENKLHALKLGLADSGERHKNSKLTDAQVIEIRELKGKMSQSNIARKYGVSQTHVSAIHLNKIRKELYHE